METSDTLSQAPDLSPDTAADAFAALLDPPEVKKPEKATQADAKEPPEKTDPEAEPNTQEEGDDAPPDDEKVTIEVDGKTVELSKAELADAYKNGLRQADYTQKTMAVAEARKAAEAEVAKAQQERHAYAVNLQKMDAQLEGAIAEQNQIDWNALLQSDPLEFMKQKHLFDQRQAALHQTRQEQARIAQQVQAEHEQSQQAYLRAQREQLLAKLPDWKDAEKAKAQGEALKTYLQTQGFDARELDISDHRAVILADKAMKYDAMMAKAKQAAQKVETLPQKTLKPGVGEKPNTDGRSAAMRQLSKTGSLEAAAATGVFG